MFGFDIAAVFDNSKSKIGTKLGKNMEVAGGLILLGIGLKILIEAMYF